MKKITFLQVAVFSFFAFFSGCIGVGTLSAQIITTIAGNGIAGYSGDGGPATAAKLNTPSGVACDANGNIYIADTPNNRIRKVGTLGNITTIAGNGTAGYSGDGGAATAAELNAPHGMTVDAYGNIYVTDGNNNRVRKINTSGIISTFAGNGVAGYSGNGGTATAAELRTPSEITFDSYGNAFISDAGNQRIRKVNTYHTISTYAGNGVAGYSGDGGQATAAEFNGPVDVYIDTWGNAYIADKNNNRIRKINHWGVISTYAGNGTAGYSGDAGAATAAEINGISGVRTDAGGNVYIADNGNNRMREVGTTGTINTLAGGTARGYTGDGGEARAAELYNPGMMTFDKQGNLYFIDHSNNVIRKIYLFLDVSTGIIANDSCNGSSNGSVMSTASYGVPPYSYSWSGGVGTDSVASGLSAGTYTISATDNTSITGSAKVTITQPLALKESLASITYPNDSGTPGIATIGVQYGTPPYTYTWSPNTNTKSIETALSAGSYTVSVTDNNGCTTSLSFNTTDISFPIQPRWAKRGMYLYLDGSIDDDNNVGMDELEAYKSTIISYCASNNITYVVIFNLMSDDNGSTGASGWVFDNPDGTLTTNSTYLSNLKDFISQLKAPTSSSGGGVEEVGVGYETDDAPTNSGMFNGVLTYNSTYSAIDEKIDFLSLDEEYYETSNYGGNYLDDFNYVHLPLLTNMYNTAQECNCVCNGPNLRVEDFLDYSSGNVTFTELSQINTVTDRILFAEYISYWKTNIPYGISDGNWRGGFDDIGGDQPANYRKEIWGALSAENSDYVSTYYGTHECVGYNGTGDDFSGTDLWHYSDVLYPIPIYDESEYIENLYYTDVKNNYATYPSTNNQFQILGSIWFYWTCMSAYGESLGFSNPISTYLPFYVTVGPDQYTTGSPLPVTANVSELSPNPPYTYTWYDMNTGTILGTVTTSSTSNTYTLPYNSSNNSYATNKLGVVVQDNAASPNTLTATDYLCIYGQYTGPVTALSPISASTLALCSGGSTTLTETPPIPGFSYSWSPSTDLSATAGTSVVATPTANITYTVTGTNAACSLSLSTSISIITAAPAELTLQSIVYSPNDCPTYDADITLNSDPFSSEYYWSSSNSSFRLSNSTTTIPEDDVVLSTAYGDYTTISVYSSNACGNSPTLTTGVNTGAESECSGEQRPVKPQKDKGSDTLADVRNVYPNPAKTSITIDISTGANAQSEKEASYYLYLYDELGELIETYLVTNNLTTLSLQNLSEGIYYYRITDNNQNLIKSDKLLIIH